MARAAKNAVEAIIFASLILSIQIAGINVYYVFGAIGLVKNLTHLKTSKVNLFILIILLVQCVYAVVSLIVFEQHDQIFLESAVKGIICFMAAQAFCTNDQVWKFTSYILILNILIAIIEIADVVSIETLMPFLNTFTAGNEYEILRSSGIAGIGGAMLAIVYVVFGVHLLKLEETEEATLLTKLIGWSLIIGSIIFGLSGIVIFLTYYVLFLVPRLVLSGSGSRRVQIWKLVGTCALFSIVLVLVAFPGIWLIEFAPINRFYNVVYRISQNNSATTIVNWLMDIGDYITVFGNGEFGREGATYLPDPGIIRYLHGAGIIGVLIFFATGIYLFLFRKRIDVDILATAMLFMKEWAYWGMFGLHIITFKKMQKNKE